MEFTRRAGSHQKSFVTYSGCKFDVQRWPYRSTVYLTWLKFSVINRYIRAASCGNTLQRKSVNVIVVARAMICLRLNNAGVNEIDKICYKLVSGFQTEPESHQGLL